MRRDEPTPAELLAAYVDGVAELSPDERHRVEAELAAAPAPRAEQAEVRALLDRLRELPPAGHEPDWGALERSIRDAVGTEVPRPWWRRWTWLAPITTCATAALVLLIVWGRPQPVPRALPAVERAEPRVERRDVEAPASDEPVALWLDGAELDVDGAELDLDPRALDALMPPDGAGDDADAEDGALLPATDLAWVDGLDDESIDRAERWLAGKTKG